MFARIGTWNFILETIRIRLKDMEHFDQRSCFIKSIELPISLSES